MSIRIASRHRTVRVVLFSFMLALLVLAGCSSDEFRSLLGSGPLSLIVPDVNNNRVLIYKSPFSTNQNAEAALGQPDFTSSGAGGTATTMNQPSDVTIDPSGNILVAETSNCRVTQFRSPFTTGMSASLVLGQPDLTTVACNLGGPPPASATNLSAPTGVASTAAGNIVVADNNYNRVLIYAAPLSNGMAAGTALGQVDLASSACTTSSTGMCGPVGVATDPSGHIWVADTGNNRVLRFTAPFSTNMAADLEVGQPSGTAFTSSGANNGGLSASSLDTPVSVVSDGSGAIWVADENNNRVLRFAPPFTNGMSATTVLGQPDFTSNASGIAANALSAPQGFQLMSDGLFVGDSGNNRTIFFPAPLSNGMNATIAIGQPDLVSNAANQGGAVAANTQSSPYGAGPSLIALAVFATLVAGWGLLALYRRRQRVTA